MKDMNKEMKISLRWAINNKHYRMAKPEMLVQKTKELIKQDREAKESENKLYPTRRIQRIEDADYNEEQH